MLPLNSLGVANQDYFLDVEFVSIEEVAANGSLVVGYTFDSLAFLPVLAQAVSIEFILSRLRYSFKILRCLIFPAPFKFNSATILPNPERPSLSLRHTIPMR